MKKVLMVSYSFPPAGGPGVQRSLKFSKYLPDFGWNPVILTRKTGKMMLMDPSFDKDIPQAAEIVRTPSYSLLELPGILGLAGKLVGRKILIPDAERLWAERARRTAESIIKKDGIKVLYTSSVPYSSHLLGLKLKDSFPSLRWIADFRDEWTNNPYLLDKPHNRIRMSIERGMERKVLKTADRLVINTPVMLDNFCSLYPHVGLERKSTVIPNGFDTEDFKDFNKEKPKNSKFTIVYTGSFYGRRTPDIFLTALAGLFKRNLAEKNGIRVKFIGTCKENRILHLINQHELENVVEVLPYMPHDACIGQMYSADALLLVEGGGKGGEAFYTGKLFEYIFAGRPIIGNLPVNGAAADIIRATGTGKVADCDDREGLVLILKEFYECWQNGTTCIAPDKNEIAKYDRKTLTGKLAEIFEDVLKY